MKSEGYEVRWTENRKNITYTTPAGMKCRDNRIHEEKYTKEVMEHEFRIRAAIAMEELKRRNAPPSITQQSCPSREEWEIC